MIRVRKWGLSPLLAALLVLVTGTGTAQATPGLDHGNYAWYNPGTTATNGLLKMYSANTTHSSVTAGSGKGSNWNNPCVSSQGRLPNGWYNTGNDKHINNKNTLIKGRVWGLADKNCGSGTIRTELFIHTEENVANLQTCTAAPDDPYCWEGSFDYMSEGCVKVSWLPGITTVHNWWHSTNVAGHHSTSYTAILYVGDNAPPS